MKELKYAIAMLALLGFTATGVALYPAYREAGAANPAPPDPVTGNLRPGAMLSADRPKVEVVFVLDTTGSMGGLIQAAKEKVWEWISPFLPMRVVRYGADFCPQLATLDPPGSEPVRRPDRPRWIDIELGQQVRLANPEPAVEVDPGAALRRCRPAEPEAPRRRARRT